MTASTSLAAQGQRSGKYRHIYGEAAKKENSFQEIQNPMTSGEGRYVAANDKFFAVSRTGGGGPVYVLPLDKPLRLLANTPLLAVHSGKTLDMDFHPFISNMIATASEDCSLRVTSFPMDGLTKTINEADVVLKGHGKKVALVTFNPSANSIVATGSFDRTVRLWNIETQECLATFDDPKDNIFSLEWNSDGSQLACTGKDKKLRIFDPRIPDEAASVDAFAGAKSSKCFWIPNLTWIGSTGFNKTAKRQLKFWDLRDLTKTVFSTDIDQAASVLMPYYDNDNGVLYMSGKGDGSVQFSEIINDNKKWYPLGGYRSPEPQKGGGWVAKRCLNVHKCEVNRFLKLTSRTVTPISFIVPRKSGADVFQEDIYPDCYAGKVALSADSWLSGENRPPVTMSMDPSKRSDGGDVAVFTKKMTYKELAKENIELKARVAELEQQLGIDNANGDDEQKDDAEEEAGYANADEDAADAPADEPANEEEY